MATRSYATQLSVGRVELDRNKPIEWSSSVHTARTRAIREESGRYYKFGFIGLFLLLKLFVFTVQNFIFSATSLPSLMQ